MANSNLSSLDISVTGPAIPRTTLSDQFSSSVASTTAKETATFATLEPFTLSQRGRGGRARGNGHARVTRPHQTMAQNINRADHLKFKKFFVMKSQNDESIWKTTNIIKASKELERYLSVSPEKITKLKI